MKALVNYFSGVWAEVSRVEWPKISDVARLTLMVFIISAIVSLYVGGLDLGFTKLLELTVKTR